MQLARGGLVVVVPEEPGGISPTESHEEMARKSK